MGVLSNIFGKKKEVSSVHGKEVKITVDNEGNISTNYSANVMGVELNIPIHTNVDKLIQESEIREVNKANNQSCEKEPEADEIKVPISFFTTENIVYAGEKCSFFSLLIRAKKLGYNYITIKKENYKEALNNIAKGKRQDYIIQRTANLNMRGIAFEKEGRIEEAIRLYEENVSMRSNGRHAYDRLAILYRKMKDKENEIRILNVAISAFGEKSEYKEQLDKAIGVYKKPEIILPREAIRFCWDNKTFGEEYQEAKLLFPEFDFYNSGENKTRSFLDSEYKNVIWRIQNIFNELIKNAEGKEKEGRLDEAAIIYERIISQQYYLPSPYDRLIKIYAKANLKEDEKYIILHSINFFSKLKSNQKKYVLFLAEKYDKLDFVKGRIDNGEKITYYLGAFELYNPYPIIDKWEERLNKLSK